MKSIIAFLFSTVLLSSCAAQKTGKKENTSDITTSVIVEKPQEKKDSLQITTATGVKVGTTKPVSEMDTMPTQPQTDSVVEINPQQFVPPGEAQVFDHSPFNELLQNHVSEKGVVSYTGFQKNNKKLRAYIASLSETMPDESWSKNEKLAYWMNAYNAMTIDLILRNLPLKSIKDIDKPWDQRLWKLGEKWYNLDEIEHQILRKMDEPRIHFGINCASYSCPPLLNEAFTAEKVDAQLDFLANTFINDSTRNTISRDSVEISKIFNWFSKDFKQNGSIIDYLNQYANRTISANAKVRYKDYNWELNN
jgi:Protein of unknown function, DUF547